LALSVRNVTVTADEDRNIVGFDLELLAIQAELYERHRREMEAECSRKQKHIMEDDENWEEGVC